jgi:hypothetical protein
MDSFILPTQALDPKAGYDDVLSSEQCHSWRENGYTLVDGVLEQELVDDIRRSCCANNRAPTPGESTTVGDNGFRGILFPSLHADTESINHVTLHPRIINACSQLLNCKQHDLRLSQSELWPKFSSADSTTAVTEAIPTPGSSSVSAPSSSSGISPFDKSGKRGDQRIHIDGFNHYLTFPNEWYRPDAVAMIIYYDDTTLTGGGTALVSRQGLDDEVYHQVHESSSVSTESSSSNSPLLLTPGGRGDLPWIDDRIAAESYLVENHPDVHAFRKLLYTREKQVQAKPGTILFYRLDVW